MLILGVDPALSVTGYGVIRACNNRLELVEAGIISTLAEEEVPRRLDKIYRGITKLILDTRPECLVLEKIYSHYRHPVTAYILGQARGVICLACARENVPLVEYGATRVKKAIVGKGLASKVQIQRMVAGLLGFDEKLSRHSDVTDALALAIAHSYIMKVAPFGDRHCERPVKPKLRAKRSRKQSQKRDCFVGLRPPRNDLYV